MLFNSPRKNISKLHKQNFGLTKSNFEELLQGLQNGDEELTVHIYEYHINSCANYLMKEFEIKKNAAHDLCMETLMEFRGKLLSGKIKYGNLKFLFTRMAYNNFIDQYKKQQKLNECIQYFLKTQSNEIDTEEFLSILFESVESLSEKDEVLIKDVYLMEKDIKELAKEYNISYDSLRKRKERALKKLKELFFIRYSQQV